MKIASDLLYELARSSSALLDGREGELELGTEISPIITIPRAQRRGGSAPAAEIQRESFFGEATRTRAASAAAVTDTRCTIGQGLWLIRLYYWAIADFTQVITGDRQFRIDMADPTGLASTLVTYVAVANTLFKQVSEFLVLLTDDSWTISMTTQATGVGQTTQHGSTVMGRILL